MSRNSETSSVTRRNFLVGAGSTAAAGCLIVGGAPNAHPAGAPKPTTANYIVTCDAMQRPIKYSTPQLADAKNLQVKTHEVVIWKAKTSGSKHHLALIFAPRTPFIDSSGNPVWAFHGSQADEANGIGIDASIDPTASGDYKYFVGVWDDDAKKSHSDDPKIIVGRPIDAAKAELMSADEKLKEAVELDPSLGEKINPIENNLQDVINGLSKSKK